MRVVRTLQIVHVLDIEDVDGRPRLELSLRLPAFGCLDGQHWILNEVLLEVLMPFCYGRTYSLGMK